MTEPETKVQIRMIIIGYLIFTLILIWGLAFLKIAWSDTEVDIYLEDGDYFFVNEDNHPYEPEVHLDSRFHTIRTAAMASWGVITILTLVMVIYKFESE